MYNFEKMALEASKDFIEWRKLFHQYPELSFEEVNTTKKIVEILKDIGYEEIRVGIPLFPQTGVIAELNPGKKGKCVAIRSDIDALPVNEQTDVSYKSNIPGVMHACGHDAHIAMLLGVAKVLYSIKDEIDGNVKLIFQPGEENNKPGVTDKTGARLLYEDSDELNDIDAVFGLHVWGTLPSGVICYRPGPMMTTNMVANLEIEGVGGHGAMPHTCVDPIIIACQIVNAWQTIVSREVNPLDMSVLTVGKIESEGSWNIIPDKASLICGVRTLNFDLIQEIRDRMKEIAEGIGKSMRANIIFNALIGVPPVVNDEKLTKMAVQSVEKAIGKENTMLIDPVMPSEDFSWYQKAAPGVLFFLGIGDESKGTNYAQHHPKYKVDDDALSNGVAAILSATFDFINNPGIQ